MLRDVFYYGAKPNVHPREQFAKNLEDARQKCTTEHFWIINEFSNYRNFDWDFDFEFLPDEDVWAIDHNNVWPSQHQKDSGTWLCPQEHSDIIVYRSDVDPVIRKNEKSDYWIELDTIDNSKFDFSWHPDSTDPPYIYKWGCKFYPAQLRHVLEYVVPGATQEKYMPNTVELLPRNECWIEYENIDKHKFDMTWRPDPMDPPFIYVWGNKYYDGKTFPTLEYRVPGATDIKHMPEPLELLSDLTNWEIPYDIDLQTFDFAWKPNPTSPPYIYQFGTIIDNNDGPRYVTPGHNDHVVYLKRTEIATQDTAVINQYYIETTLDDLVKQHPNEIFWALRKNIDYTLFDFDWRPATVEVAWELNYVHVFGSIESELTQTYFVSAKNYLNGQRELKFVEAKSLFETNLADMFVKPDMFFIDRGNQHSNQRYEELKLKFGNRIRKTRYLNSWVDTINRCTIRSNTELFWVLNSELDYSEFNFDYYPNPWQMKMVHVFGTQWSHWGTTFLVNRETFTNDTKWIKIIEHLPNLNFVKNLRATATACLYDVLLIDHGNRETTSVEEQLSKKISGKTITKIAYDESYLNTLRNYVKQIPVKKEHYLWVCSSVCDYDQFDFTYICDPFAKENLHVFPSGTQKFGDTFLIDVNKTRELVDELEALQDYDKVNYNGTVKAQRLPEPILVTLDDTHINMLSKITGFPYATVITSDNIDVGTPVVEPMNLWSPDTKNIIVTSTGATRIVIPSEAKDIVKKELYDYPYIKRSPKLLKSSPMDIVFLSNGETKAEENWEHLLNVTKGLPNRVVRVDGVNGRAAAYHAAANASETPWMFTVFAKLKVSPKFDWNWQPDRMQVPKHYIFHAKNPVNGLTYGHQAMIAYNKDLTLANEGRGLDFTLDDEHETVPLISGTAHYNTDEFSTWRTAFREVLKLYKDTTEDSRIRLEAWLNVADGDFAEYSIKGARDAEQYYNEVQGNFDKLKLSYEWAWLKEYFDKI
jgi:hypothetical protein